MEMLELLQERLEEQGSDIVYLNTEATPLFPQSEPNHRVKNSRCKAFTLRHSEL